MRRLVVMSMLTLGLMMAPLSQVRAFDQNEQKVMLAGLVAVALVYHNYVLAPTAKWVGYARVVFAAGYGAPALAALGAYIWAHPGLFSVNAYGNVSASAHDDALGSTVKAPLG